MNPVVESALISAAATLVSVGGTVAVAMMGFQNSRLANQATITATEQTTAAAREANQAAIDAAHADVRIALDATRDGQVADRYSRAIEQLGSNVLNVRIGAIYALERVAVDSVRDYPTVMEVLAAFIREQSRWQWPPGELNDAPAPQRTTRPDVQAAVTVIGRRDSRYDRQPVNLSDANLTRADLTEANLGHANLSRADLTGASLLRTNLTSASLVRANLTEASLGSTNLKGAHLNEANLGHAILSEVDLADADLADADLANAFLAGVHLNGANLTRVLWPSQAEIPDGWDREAGSGRLSRA